MKSFSGGFSVMNKYIHKIQTSRSFLPIVLSFLIFSSCKTQIPETDLRCPWFETENDLLVKAEILEQSTLEMVDSGGVLCYKAFLPWNSPFDENQLKSYDMADFPAWQGYLLAAFAFKQAVTGESEEDVISLLLDGFQTSWRITGIDGLLCRSMIPGYIGDRLDYMDTWFENPTKYWTQGPTGEWFKCGAAAGHYSGTVFGLSMLLFLDRDGYISLSDTVRQQAETILVTTVRYVVDNNYTIVDHDGKVTDYGYLDPSFFNSYFAVAMLNYLKSAGTYDNFCAQTYQQNVDTWTKVAEEYNRLLGDVMLAVGRWTAERVSTSDTLHYACQNFALMLQEEASPYTERLATAADSVWDFFQYERHPIYTYMMLDRIRPEDRDLFMPAIIQDLRDFPIDKKDGREEREETPAQVQPLANRYISSFYWKSTCYARFVEWVEPPDENAVTYSGGDYLLAYWMGRYLGLVPER